MGKKDGKSQKIAARAAQWGEAARKWGQWG